MWRAQALADAGANLVPAARRSDPLEELARSIEAAGGTAVAVTCDVGDAGPSGRTGWAPPPPPAGAPGCGESGPGYGSEEDTS